MPYDPSYVVEQGIEYSFQVTEGVWPSLLIADLGFLPAAFGFLECASQASSNPSSPWCSVCTVVVTKIFINVSWQH